MILVKRALAVASLALGGLAVSAGPASAAVGATIDSVDRDGCELTVNVTVEDAGTYYLFVFDDSVILGSDSAVAAAGATVQLRYTIVSDVNSGAPGLGLGMYDDPEASGDLLDSLDPYDFPGSDDIATACAESGGEDSGETTTTVSTPDDPTTTTPEGPTTTAPDGPAASTTVAPTPSATSAPSAGESPSNIEAPASDGDGPSSPVDAPSSSDDAPGPILAPKFTG